MDFHQLLAHVRDFGGWLIALVLAGIIALRADIRFDVNQWIKDRREHRLRYLKSLCPHAELVEEEGRYTVVSVYP